MRAGGLSLVGVLLRLDALSLLFLLLAYEGANHSHFVVVVLVEVEAELLGGAQLHQVVVERFLGDLHLGGCILERHLDELAILVEARVELAPLVDLLDDFLNCAFLDARLALISAVLLRLHIDVLSREIEGYSS